MQFNFTCEIELNLTKQAYFQSPCTFWTDNPGFGLIRIGIQGKNFEILYIFYVACSIYLYTILKRSVLMNDMRVSENCIDLNS